MIGEAQMNVIKEVAKQYGTTPEEVRQEMIAVIRTGRKNLDPKVQAMWKKLFPDGKEPTPEQFIRVLSDAVRQKSGC